MEIKFIKSWRGYQIGSTQDFPEDQAKFLASPEQGIAVIIPKVKKSTKTTLKKKSVGRPKKNKMIKNAPKQKVV